MKIIELHAENVKRLKAVTIRPDGNVVVVGGANAQGKTSVLDSIWLALGGRAGSKDTSEPIRQGETKAVVRLDLGDLIVERTWVGPNTSLTVKAKDGAKYSSPQAVLDRLVGKLTFDPLAFANAPAKAQRETLLDIIELPFDPADHAGRRQAYFDRRTLYNRNAKQLKARFDALPTYPDGTPNEPVDVKRVVDHRDFLVRRGQRLDALRAERDDLQNRLEAIHLEASQIVTEIDPSTWRQEIEALSGQIANAQAINDAIVAMRQRSSVHEELERELAQVAAMTEHIGTLDDLKANALAEASMPVPGLGFDDDGVTLNGVPFSQASGAEKLKVSLAIAAAANPELRVVRITDGSLLDDANMAMLQRFAQERDLQVWIERVGDRDAVAVVIEDGEVRG